MIDWTKEVELLNGIPAHVACVLPSGSAIIWWGEHPVTNEPYVVVLPPTTDRIRNVPPKSPNPREWWIQWLRTGVTLVYENRPDGQTSLVHVREVPEDK
jgi:hypothetical protein